MAEQKSSWLSFFMPSKRKQEEKKKKKKKKTDALNQIVSGVSKKNKALDDIYSWK